MKPSMRILYYSTSEADQPLVRQALRQARQRFDCLETNSLSEFEQKLAAGHFDAALADFNPKAARGSECVTLCRDQLPGVPVILLVDPDLENMALEAVKQGATDYVVKTAARIRRLPFSIEIALDRARIAEDGKKAKNELTQLTLDLEKRVTDRTAQLASANQELEAFSYSVSHDLRAPLRAIEGFAQILLEDHSGQLDPEARRCLNVIITSTERMNRLIEDLLAFSRLTRAEFETRPINMTELAQSAAGELRRSDPNSKAQITIPPLLPVKADAAMLRQVWINLISNALKFSRKQSNPEIELGSYIDGSEQVYYVKDNGVGFDMQYAPKLFNVFQRLHRSDQFEGTGVGLAIVRRIIHRHGGRTWAEGKVGAGATFWFSLPVEGENSSRK